MFVCVSSNGLGPHSVCDYMLGLTGCSDSTSRDLIVDACSRALHSLYFSEVVFGHGYNIIYLGLFFNTTVPCIVSYKHDTKTKE